MKLWIAAGTLASMATAGCAPPLEERLRNVPGLRILSSSALGSEGELFELAFEQPLDHEDAAAGTFDQPLQLLVRKEDAPVVLNVSGYELEDADQNEPGRLVEQGNVLSVGHRFYDNVPDEALPWSLLTIGQAVGDLHQVVDAFSSILPGAWLSTGISKGAGLALAHRRHFPNDVVGTVAYVAPISTGLPDDRFAAHRFPGWMDDCLTAARASQREAIKQLPAVVEEVAIERNLDSTAATALHATAAHRIIRAVYGPLKQTSDDTCHADAEYGVNAAYVRELAQENEISISTFDSLHLYEWQILSELGDGRMDTAHVDDLIETVLPSARRLLGVRAQTLAHPPPWPSAPRYDPSEYLAVERFVAEEAENVILIYGEADPFTAFMPETIGAAVTLITVSGWGHTANLAKGEAATCNNATALISDWVQSPVACPAYLSDGTE